jgi:hypothetical protein
LGQVNTDTEARLAELVGKAQVRARDMKALSLKHFYIIVSIDSPMDNANMKNNKTAFKFLGYIKRKPTATGFATHPWSDDHIRFAHDNWKNHMFRPVKRTGPNHKHYKEVWWGRTEQERIDWLKKARHGTKFNEH